MSVTPKKSLGQHFLVDENILGVIGRLADLQPDDVVLEVGPGLGILTRYLAARVAHVHAVELDRSLEPHLTDVPKTSLHWQDALRLDATALDPPPAKPAPPLVEASVDVPGSGRTAHRPNAAVALASIWLASSS